jgi:mono/diheme cytochrome c family protein
MRPFFAVVVSVVLAGCVSPSGIAPPVTPALVSASRGGSATQLEEGRRIFLGACTACHAADPVHAHSLEAWQEDVAEMAKRSKLTPAQQTALLAYIAAAKAMPPAP